jgi:hypothetical protein
MALLLKLLSNNLDNDIVVYSTLIVITGAIGYSFIINALRKSYVEKGVQTNTEKNIYDSLEDDLTSINTLSPKSSTSTLKALTTKKSEVGTQTMTEEVNIVDFSNTEYIATKVEQLNALDPFSATPWTPERLREMIDTLGIVNNLFN